MGMYYNDSSNLGSVAGGLMAGYNFMDAIFARRQEAKDREQALKMENERMAMLTESHKSEMNDATRRRTQEDQANARAKEAEVGGEFSDAALAAGGKDKIPDNVLLEGYRRIKPDATVEEARAAAPRLISIGSDVWDQKAGKDIDTAERVAQARKFIEGQQAQDAAGTPATPGALVAPPAAVATAIENSAKKYGMEKYAGAAAALWQTESSLNPAALGPPIGGDPNNRARGIAQITDVHYAKGGLFEGQDKQGDFDMISVSPFIPHPQTALANEPAGGLTMTLKMTALARIVSRNAHIPATTAIGSLQGRDERPKALAAGANVLMPNFTPAPYRRYYEIYPNTRCVSEEAGACTGCMERLVAAIGRRIDTSRGDSLKPQSHANPAETKCIDTRAK